MIQGSNEISKKHSKSTHSSTRSRSSLVHLHLWTFCPPCILCASSM